MCMLCVCYSMDRINDLIYFKNEINGTNDERQTEPTDGWVGSCAGRVVGASVTWCATRLRTLERT